MGSNPGISNVETALWRNNAFVKLFSAHAVSLLGTGLTSVALGLLAHELAEADVAKVMGITLAIRIAIVVVLAPFAGHVSDWIGAKATLLLSDVTRAAIVPCFLLVTEVWQIYLLAFFLNLVSALFTPVYKACIPNIVTIGQYPRALAYGSIAYDFANIAGPALAGLGILFFGFRGNFVLNAAAFLVSALLIMTVRLFRPPPVAREKRTARMHGIRAMLSRKGLLESLFFSARVAVISGFVLVATVHYVKNSLGLGDDFYAWAMTAYGIGSVAGAFAHTRLKEGHRRIHGHGLLPWFIPGALLMVALTDSFGWLLAAWMLAGAGQVALGIRSNQLLALHSEPAERPHIYAAHFSLSHAGWGVTYPLAGWATAGMGFNRAASLFCGLYLVLTLGQMIGFRYLRKWERPGQAFS